MIIENPFQTLSLLILFNSIFESHYKWMFIKIQSNQDNKTNPLILLHGWGFSHHIWNAVATELSHTWQVYQVDLPGHGQSPFCEYHLLNLLNILEKNLPKNAVWIGWSLGGLLAMAMAIYKPNAVRALVLVASSPRFVIDENWQCALSPEILEKFNQQLQENTVDTVRRFLFLQVQGSETAKQQLRYLQEFLTYSHIPDSETLKQGLHFLLHTDLRAELHTISCPALLCLGERDKIVPVDMGQHCLHYWKNLHIVEIPKAAHIPFLSHFDIFMHTVKGFLNEHGIT
jgi:pimeloyl-[acyl-carrier protein] methyl ester esterase